MGQQRLDNADRAPVSAIAGDRIAEDADGRAPLDDRDVAKGVRDAVRELNTALSHAYDAGLHVDLDYIGRQSIGRAGSLRIYRATIERREVIA